MDMVKAVNDLLEDDLALRTWLTVRDPDSVVGHVQSPCNCPLANFLRSATVHGFYSVDIRKIMIDYVNSYDLVENPEWVRRFIFAVDNSLEHSEVTAAEALTILDQVRV